MQRKATTWLVALGLAGAVLSAGVATVWYLSNLHHRRQQELFYAINLHNCDAFARFVALDLANDAREGRCWSNDGELQSRIDSSITDTPYLDWPPEFVALAVEPDCAVWRRFAQQDDIQSDAIAMLVKMAPVHKPGEVDFLVIRFRDGMLYSGSQVNMLPASEPLPSWAKHLR